MPLWRLGHKTMINSILDTLFPSSFLLWWSQLPCWELPQREDPWQGTKEGFRPTISEKLRPLVQQLTWNWVLPRITWMILNLEVGPPPFDPADQTTFLAHSLITDSERPKGRGTQLSHAWIPDLQKLWDNKCCLKMLRFGGNLLSSDR